jgi:hypothetical protein
MARKSNRAEQLSEEDFDAKYARDTQEGEAVDGNEDRVYRGLQDYVLSPGSPIKSALPYLNDWWLVRQLRAAAQENSPDAYKIRLDYFLSRWLDAEPPEGVLTPFAKSRGRRWSPETEKIWLTWKDIGRPPLTRIDLANAFYGERFKSASGEHRKRMIDRCRAAVTRKIKSGAD